MKTALCSIVVVCFFITLVRSLPIESLSPFPKAKWTIAVYMNGDNELEPSITGGEITVSKHKIFNNPSRKNLNYTAPGDFHTELAALGSNEDVHVVALVDRAVGYAENMDNWTETRLYYIRKDDYPDNTHGLYWVKQNETSGNNELNMANVQTLQWFLQTVAINFPSDHLYLSLWDHNWGWHAGYFQKDETNEFATINYELLSSMLASADASHNLPHIDILGYDACVASHWEVLDTWSPYIDYFVGSQDYVGYGGVNYATVIEYLQQTYSKESSSSVVKVAQIIAHSMLTDREDKCVSVLSPSNSNNNNNNNNSNNNNNKTDSAYLTFIKDLNILATLFLTNIHHPSMVSSLHHIRQQLSPIPHYYSDAYHIDVYTMLQAMIKEFSALSTSSSSSSSSSSNILPSSQSIIDIAQEMLLLFPQIVIYNEIQTHHDVIDYYASCDEGHGLSLFWPKTRNSLNDDHGKEEDWENYLQLSFAKRTQWDEFLDVYLRSQNL
jgi:hypothetical protein